MKGELLLSGTWQGSGRDAKGEPLVFDARVPGCVHTDLQKAGVIGDFYWRDNSRGVQWIENGDFTFSRTFFVENIADNAFLEFDGLDTYCSVWLNGVCVGKAENMFLSHAFAVDGVLQKGENRLEVRFVSPVRAVEGKEPLRGAFTTERLHTRRMQCTYGWDWVDRFVTMGIYRDVRLVFRRANEIAHAYVTTEHLLSDSAQVRVQIHLQNVQSNGETLSLRILSPDGTCAFEKSRTVLTEDIDEWIDLTNPRLWFPNGYGEQPLYTLEITTPSSEKRITFGIRELVIRQTVDAPGSPEEALCREIQTRRFAETCDHNKTTSGFTVFVNNVPIFCQGADWVPCEPFPSAETPEKIERLLTLGAKAHLNFLRVWGGGIFEQDAFYDVCDRLGILVAQDFLMACGHYPEHDAWFLDQLRQEARAGAYRLRNHACLAWWNGDNENAVMGDENKTDFPGYLAAQALEPVLREVDPHRRFLPSSPFGGEPYSSATRGTTHVTFYLGDFFRYVREDDFTSWRAFAGGYLSRFNAEQPAMGMPFVSSLKQFMTDEDIFGADDTISEFHTKNNPALGKITLYQYFDIMTQKLFGAYRNGEERVTKMQWMHCEWVRLTLETARRHEWFSSGILYWMYNDCWPAANSWSLVDYYGSPKPAYYVFKRCAKPVIASLAQSGEELTVTVSNHALAPCRGRGRVYLYDFIADRALWEESFAFTVPQNGAECVHRAPFAPLASMLSPATVLLCDIETENKETDRAFLIPARYADLDLTYQPVRITEETENTLTVTADAFTPFALLDLPYPVSENAFCLKKGEYKTIQKER